MNKNETLCLKCGGRKQLFKVGGGYTYIENGTDPVDCPRCLGKGFVPTLDATVEALNKNKDESSDGTKKQRRKAKDKTV